MNVDDAGSEHQSPSPRASRAHVLALVVFGVLVASVAVAALSAWLERSRTIEAALTLLGFAMDVVRTLMATSHNNPQP